MKILAIEPYYGGSHKAFIDVLTLKSSYSWQLLKMPAENWKWRMRASAIVFARQANHLNTIGYRFDAVLATDMMNLGDFIAFAAEELYNVPKILYFHENQLTYPIPENAKPDSQLGLINITSALAAHAVWFNSAYHRDDFLTAAEKYLGKMPDYNCLDILKQIESKSQVVSPFIDKRASKLPLKKGALRIVWAARWEHDKNPECFFAAMRILKQRGVDFTLSVLGEPFGQMPDIFQNAANEFSENIVNWGFIKCPNQYHKVLLNSDVFVSTAIHEFFGISAVEAAAAGCCVMVPRRLAYTEVFEDAQDAFYNGSFSDLVDKLIGLSENRAKLVETAEKCRQIAVKYRWQDRIQEVERLIKQVPKHRPYFTLR